MFMEITSQNLEHIVKLWLQLLQVHEHIAGVGKTSTIHEQLLNHREDFLLPRSHLNPYDPSSGHIVPNIAMANPVHRGVRRKSGGGVEIAV